MTTLLHPKPQSASPIFVVGLKGAKHVDAIMRGVQGASEKTQVDRFNPLSVRMGVAGTLKLRAKMG